MLGGVKFIFCSSSRRSCVGCGFAALSSFGLCLADVIDHSFGPSVDVLPSVAVGNSVLYGATLMT
jgi:hypothetical protein